MSELSIKVTIAGRVYPLTIADADEEMVRKAVKLLDERIKALQQTYSVKDRQDLLAMSALQVTTQVLRSGAVKPEEGIHLRAESLLQTLDSYLS